MNITLDIQKRYFNGTRFLVHERYCVMMNNWIFTINQNFLIISFVIDLWSKSRGIDRSSTRIVYIEMWYCVLSGRVHSAIVSGVNWEQRSVTVEWFEKGETKGKEVSCVFLFTDKVDMIFIFSKLRNNNGVWEIVWKSFALNIWRKALIFIEVEIPKETLERKFDLSSLMNDTIIRPHVFPS